MSSGWTPDAIRSLNGLKRSWVRLVSDAQSWQNHDGWERGEICLSSKPELSEHLKWDNLEQLEQIMFLLPVVIGLVQPIHFSRTLRSEIVK